MLRAKYKFLYSNGRYYKLYVCSSVCVWVCVCIGTDYSINLLYIKFVC